MDEPHQILMDEGTVLGNKGRELYSCFTVIADGLRTIGASQLSEFSAQHFPASMADTAAAVSKLIGAPISKEGKISIDSATAEGLVEAYRRRSTRAAPRGSLHGGRSTGVAP